MGEKTHIHGADHDFHISQHFALRHAARSDFHHEGAEFFHPFLHAVFLGNNPAQIHVDIVGKRVRRRGISGDFDGG